MTKEQLIEKILDVCKLNGLNVSKDGELYLGLVSSDESELKAIATELCIKTD